MALTKYKSALHDIIETAIEFIYEKAVGKDLRSKIRIQKFGEYEVAFRKDTSDEKVIAHSFDRDIFFKGFQSTNRFKII